MPNLDRPAYCDWEIGWWFLSETRDALPRELRIVYCEIIWKLYESGGSIAANHGFLARLTSSTEDEIRTVLALPKFYERPDKTIGHTVVDRKLEEQIDRRLGAHKAGKASAEARARLADQKDRATARSTGRSTARSTDGGTGGATNACMPAGMHRSTHASEKRPGGTSASRTAPAPGGRGAGAGTPAAVVTPPVPGARVPVVWMDPEKSAVLSEDGEYWIDINGAGRLAVDPAKRVIPNLPGLRGTKGVNHG